jgi:hypothetical protein
LHIILLVCENDQHGLNSTAPALRSASAYGGWTCRARHSSARQFLTLFGHQHGWVGSLFLGSCQPIFRLVASRYDALLREAPGK